MKDFLSILGQGIKEIYFRLFLPFCLLVAFVIWTTNDKYDFYPYFESFGEYDSVFHFFFFIACMHGLGKTIADYLDKHKGDTRSDEFPGGGGYGG